MSLNSSVLKKFAKESKLSVKQVLAVIKLLEENNSVPFINYYRKDVTENLSVIKIQKVAASYQNYKSLLTRKELILSKIKDLDKLSDSLKSDILSCHDKTKLEDLYFPFKPNGNEEPNSSRKMKLLPLAKYIWEQMLEKNSSQVNLVKTTGIKISMIFLNLLIRCRYIVWHLFLEQKKRKYYRLSLRWKMK